jgi:transcription initiation factor TFIID subunit 2
LIEILSAKVNGHAANFVYFDPLANLGVSKPEEFNQYPELKRKLYSALSESDEGELSIGIPDQVSVTLVNPPASSAPGAVTNGATPATAAAPTTTAAASREYQPITVRIEYMVKNPGDGIQFILPSETHPFVSERFLFFL